MKLIAHRGLWQDPTQANTLSAIRKALRQGFEVETDLRSHRGKLYLSHDTMSDSRKAPSFESLLEAASAYPTQTLFLNIKEDGLLELLSPFKSQLKNLSVVFFDMSVPELVRFAKEFPPSMLATRISDFEPYPSGIQFCDWLWIDCFNRELSIVELRTLLSHFPHQCAFVSPELHGRTPSGLWHILHKAQWLDRSRAHLCTDRCLELTGGLAID